MTKKTLYFYKTQDIWPSDLESSGVPFKNWARVEVFDHHTNEVLYFFMVTDKKLYGKILETLYFNKDEDYRPFYFNNKPNFIMEIEIDTVIRAERLPRPIDKLTGKEIDYNVTFCNLSNLVESYLHNELYKQKRILEWN